MLILSINQFLKMVERIKEYFYPLRTECSTESRTAEVHRHLMTYRYRLLRY